MDWAFTVVVALLLAAVVRLFVAQVFVIPSGSMLPTLEVSDRVLVEKVSFLFSAPERGDVVVFERPEALAGRGVEDHLIKRVIGLPGDLVYSLDGQVYVNDSPLDEPWLAGGVTGSFEPVEVPAGEYFVMGDNRGGSEDSRFFGTVPSEKLVGQALLLMWPLERVESL